MTKKKIKILSLSLLGAAALLVPTAITAVSCAGSKDNNSGSNPGGDNPGGEIPTPIEKTPFAIKNNGNFDANSVNLDNSEIAYEAKSKLTKSWAWDSKSLLFTGDSVDGFNQNDITVTINSTDKDSINASIQIATGKVYVDKDGKTNSEPLIFSIKISGFKPILEFTGFKSEQDIKNALGITSSDSIAQAQQKINTSTIFAHKNKIFNGTTNLLKQSTDFNNVGKDAISITQNPYSNDAIKLSITIDKSKIFNADGQPMGSQGETETYTTNLTGFTPEKSTQKINEALTNANMLNMKQYSDLFMRTATNINYSNISIDGTSTMFTYLADGSWQGLSFNTFTGRDSDFTSIPPLTYKKQVLYNYFFAIINKNNGKLGTQDFSTSGFNEFMNNLFQNDVQISGNTFTFTFDIKDSTHKDLVKLIYNNGNIGELPNSKYIKIKFEISGLDTIPKFSVQRDIPTTIKISKNIEILDNRKNVLFNYDVKTNTGSDITYKTHASRTFISSF